MSSNLIQNAVASVIPTAFLLSFVSVQGFQPVAPEPVQPVATQPVLSSTTATCGNGKSVEVLAAARPLVAHQPLGPKPKNSNELLAGYCFTFEAAHKRTGVWYVLAVNGNTVRVQQLSADGTRLIPRKTATVAVSEVLAGSQVTAESQAA